MTTDGFKITRLIIAIALSAVALPARAQAQADGTFRVRVVAPDGFCARSVAAFIGSGLVKGTNDEDEKIHQAMTATDRLLTLLRQPLKSDYVTSAALGLDPDHQGTFLAIDALVKGPLGLDRDYLLVRNANDLRYVPLTLERSDIVVIVGHATELDEDRVQKVIAAAKAKRTSISVIWQGPRDSDELVRLAMLAAATQGVFVDLNRFGETCR